MDTLCERNYLTQPIHKMLPLPLPFFLHIHIGDMDMYSVVIKGLHGYGHEHVEEK